nr:MAG TPA: hypothetical protein [Caudoviricetes sp.]
MLLLQYCTLQNHLCQCIITIMITNYNSGGNYYGKVNYKV